MKKLFISIILFYLSISIAFGSVFADARTIDLDNMTVAELDALSAEIKEAKKAATAFDKKTKKLLEDDFSSILQTIAGEGAKVRYPLLGLNSNRELTCYQVWGDCSARTDDNVKTDFSGARAVYYYDDTDDTYHHVAFLTKEYVYFVDPALLSKVDRFLDADISQRLIDSIVEESLPPESIPNTKAKAKSEKASKPKKSSSAQKKTQVLNKEDDPTMAPLPTDDPYIRYTDIYKGNKGDAVKHLQQRLIELGYLNGKADGVFGNDTKKAVEKYQQNNGLLIDGIASAALQAVLFSEGAISLQGKSFEAYDPMLFVSPTPKPTPTAKPTSKSKPTQKVKPTSKPKPTSASKTVKKKKGSSTPSSGKGSYVGNEKTRIFHKASCGSVKQMKNSNKVYFGSREEAINRGFSGCKKCKP